MISVRPVIANQTNRIYRPINQYIIHTKQIIRKHVNYKPHFRHFHRFPTCRNQLQSSRQVQLEVAEKKASTSAIIGLSSAFLGDYVSYCMSQTSLGIVNQLALELHTTPFIAYFVIVFIAAHDVEKTTRILVLENDDMKSIQKNKKRTTNKMTRLHLIIGRASMLLFIYFFVNGLYHHGIYHEIGPLEQLKEFDMR